MTRVRMRWIAFTSLLWGAAAATAGCERVGRAFVGHDAGSLATRPSGPCIGSTPPLCTDDLVPSLASDLHLRPASRACTFVRTCRDPADADGGSAARRLPVCETVEDADELGARAQSVTSCADLRVANHAGRLGASLRLDDAFWSTSDVSIASDTPWLIELDGASLRDVSIRLAGPVTLRFVRPVKLADVRVTGVATDSGAPELVLHEVGAGVLTVGDDVAAFHGAVRMTRTTLTGSQLIADLIALESVTIADTIIEAGELDADDADLAMTTLSFENATLAGSRLFDVEVTDCGTLELLAGSAEYLRIPACRNPPLRAYYTSISRSIVDGEVESDRAGWALVVFGLHEPTDIVAWTSHFTGAQFCAQSKALRLGDLTNVTCSTCDLDPEDAVNPCAVPSTPPPIFADNLCPALQKVPKHCHTPLPVPTHPDPNTNFF
jgi:hypothetical protein